MWKQIDEQTIITDSDLMLLKGLKESVKVNSHEMKHILSNTN